MRQWERSIPLENLEIDQVKVDRVQHTEAEISLAPETPDLHVTIAWLGDWPIRLKLFPINRPSHRKTLELWLCAKDKLAGVQGGVLRQRVDNTEDFRHDRVIALSTHNIKPHDFSHCALSIQVLKNHLSADRIDREVDDYFRSFRHGQRQTANWRRLWKQAPVGGDLYQPMS